MSLTRAGVFLAVFLAVQIAIPTVQLLAPRPAPFGWQMYAATGELPTVVAFDDAGTSRVVDVLSLVAAPRAEIDYARLLADRGCDIVDAARLRIQSEGTTTEVVCR